MKHLSKLVINPEKLMTDRELVTLRGGYDIWHCTDCECDGIGLINPVYVPANDEADAMRFAEDYLQAYYQLGPHDCDCDNCHFESII